MDAIRADKQWFYWTSLAATVSIGALTQAAGHAWSASNASTACFAGATVVAVGLLVTTTISKPYAYRGAQMMFTAMMSSTVVSMVAATVRWFGGVEILSVFTFFA